MRQVAHIATDLEEFVFELHNYRHNKLITLEHEVLLKRIMLR